MAQSLPPGRGPNLTLSKTTPRSRSCASVRRGLTIPANQNAPPRGGEAERLLSFATGYPEGPS